MSSSNMILLWSWYDFEHSLFLTSGRVYCTTSVDGVNTVLNLFVWTILSDLTYELVSLFLDIITGGVERHCCDAGTSRE